jgi:hypothetical protein
MLTFLKFKLFAQVNFSKVLNFGKVAQVYMNNLTYIKICNLK